MAKLSVVRTAVERSPKRTMATMSSTRLMPESSARADERNRWSMVTSPQCGHVGLCIGRHTGDLEIHPGGACPARDEAPRREGTPGGLVVAVVFVYGMTGAPAAHADVAAKELGIVAFGRGSRPPSWLS